YNPYNTPSPTFSTLNNYYNPTPYPYNYYNPNANNYYSNNNDVKIRIWPYVIGQYLYPSYYNNNINDPYASFNNPNWQSYYANVYQNQ
ncbi:CG34265, partial [Drosophila busckii]